ncbi:PQQ-dependent sugar dehydrogenase [Planotetraspora kaengkrachanensis]|uniref:Oxidoreductase n=1 Tax=Planotetraspora kaengkrachanensis TaxID=575193 RepID=A0A8J3PW15_9ACTN|nr:PQQ-dependent sugar dehydrogenase [Planotetraspora kaengkrachanensis]GIG81993.1 oxidoreductase [Planotetraspora kaengkrachanensis]
MVKTGRFTRALALALAVTITTATACSAAPVAPAAGGGAPGQGGALTPAPLEGSAQARPSGSPRTLVTDLAVPWAIAFLPGGDALVTERDSAKLVRVTPQGQVSDVGVIEGVSPAGEGGLLGVAVSPSFATDHYVFVYFSANGDNRVVRYRYDGGLSDPVPLVTGIPKGSIHNGGRLAFGPDGYLYASTGETGERGLSQDRNSLAGKILRMTLDGKPAPGNPFGTLIWSYGHRNVQGLAWDSGGRMYATEFGQNTYDEINLIEKGHNYGWPDVEGMGGGGKYTDPLLTWSTDEASPSGLAYADGSLWAAALRGQRLWRIPLNGEGRVGRPEALYAGEYGRLRAVVTAPDGSLWVGTSNKDGRGAPRQGDDRILVVPTGNAGG